ncbi:MAG: histidine kinase [Saprospiraceae bacterium]|nr:histidine kinase [Saprospiraceae bacterium]
MTKCFRDVVGFDDKWLVVLGLPLASVLISLLLFGDVYIVEGWTFITVCIFMSFVHTAAFWLVLRYVWYGARIRYPRFEHIGIRLAWVFVAFLGVYFTLNKGIHVLFDVLSPNHSNNEPNPIVSFISAFLMSTLLIVVYEAMSFYIQLQRTEAEKATLERQNLESQLEGLRSQVNPHFLFNSLNTLTYLIPEDADKAVRFVQQLSKVYRYVLESRDTRLIPLQEELMFLKSYVYLQHERFGDNLVVDMRGLEGKENTVIVPLTLQILFENAIKHNVISSEKPLTVEVLAENGHLVVRNNLQKKNQVMDSTGVGLQNIRDRYRMLADKEVGVIASHQYFTVVLPLIEVHSQQSTVDSRQSEVQSAK